MPPKKVIIPSKLPPSTTSAPLVVDQRVLPKKESEQFRQLLLSYEAKDFQLGLKLSEALLKKYPDHGETLAMRGICYFHLDKKVQGYELVRRGVRNDMKSHIVWHVYGIIQRADHHYSDALGAYAQAHKLEPNSTNILGDLALLAMHLRRYDAYAEYRLLILRLGPRMRRNWIGLALAQHLAGQYYQADVTLTNFETMIRSVPDGEYDYGEIILYHATVLEEWGEYEKCLEFLTENTGFIVDRSTFTTMRGRLLLKLGRTESAVWAWSLLLEENPDSYEYIKACVAAKGADYDAQTEEGRAAAVLVLDDLAESHPRSLAIRRLALNIVSGEQFKVKAARYLTDALSKGIPSLFADVKSLYNDLEKRDIIGALAQTFRESLELQGKFGVTVEGEDADTIESSAAYLWTLYFLAQHHSTIAADSEALHLINTAIDHTPSLPELWMLKARILKRGGDPLGALAAMDEARTLDGQDRFLNSKHAKYLLRAEKVTEAEACVGLFTKKEAPSPLDDLIEMQCFWILREEADSYHRQQNYGMALKRWHQMFAVFDEVEDDQYDFHSYCLRKYTLRAYVDLVHYMDTLRSHPRYYSAVAGAVAIYVKIHDDPSIVTAAALEVAKRVVVIPEITEEEKKAINKAKKTEKATEAKDKGKKVANKVVEEEEVAPIVDADPFGQNLLETKDPLVEALKYLRPLEKAAPGQVSTWLLSFEIAVRRKKYLQALHALRTARSIEPHSAPLHLLTVRFALLIPSLTDLTDVVAKVLHSALTELLTSLSIETFNSSLLQFNSNDAASILVVAKGIIAIRGQDGREEAEELLFQLARPETSSSIESSIGAVEVLESISSPRIDEFKKATAQRYPLAVAFKERVTGEYINGKVDVVEKEELLD